MQRWQKKVAVVTGAGAGIGAACAQYLLKYGMRVVGLDIHSKSLDSVHSKLPKEQQKRFHPKLCDVSKIDDIVEAFAWIESHLGGTDVLINNAAIIRMTTLMESNSYEDIKATVDTNLMGVVNCTREAFQSMKKRGVDGHVFILNSISGHKIPIIPNGNLNIYPCTKHAITAMTEILRQEFMLEKTGIKVTSVSPGIVLTGMLPPEFPKDAPYLRAEDIADAVVYSLQTPPNVQIHEMIMKPLGEQI